MLGLGSPPCSKCNSEVGTYIHMFWKCKKIQTFWREVKDEVVSLIRYDLELSPPQCIYCMKDCSYISKDTPFHGWLVQEEFEKMTHTIHDNVKGFVKICKPVLDTVDPTGLDFALPDWKHWYWCWLDPTIKPRYLYQTGDERMCYLLWFFLLINFLVCFLWFFPLLFLLPLSLYCILKVLLVNL